MDQQLPTTLTFWSETVQTMSELIGSDSPKGSEKRKFTNEDEGTTNQISLKDLNIVSSQL